MNVKRLFQLVVVGGTLIGTAEGCGGPAQSGTQNTTNTSGGKVARTSDGGVTDGGDLDTGDVPFW